MNMFELFNSDGLKRSKKRKAFKKIADKLDKTKDKLERKIRTEESEAKVKNLEARLKTNNKQRRKAKMLMAELD